MIFADGQLDTDPKLIKKLPGFPDIKEVVIADVIAVWNRASCQP